MSPPNDRAQARDRAARKAAVLAQMSGASRAQRRAFARKAAADLRAGRDPLTPPEQHAAPFAPSTRVRPGSMGTDPR